MSSLCILPGCTSNRVKNPRIHLVSIPLYPRHKKEWRKELLEFCCKYRDRRAVIQAARKSSATLCDRHFAKDDFYLQNGKKKVIPGRMPTLNLPKVISDRRPVNKPYGGKGAECSAYGCNKRRKKHSKVFVVRSDSEGSEDEESEEKRKQTRTFHPFPSDPILLRKWLINIRRKDWVPDLRSVICSDHFKEEDIIRSDLCARLKPGALPTRFKLFEPRFKENHLNGSGITSSEGRTSPQSSDVRGEGRECQWAMPR